MVQAYKFALDANAGQERALRSHCGGARAAHNWAVSWVTAKRETVVRTPKHTPRCGDTVTDLPGRNAWNAESR
ncbi:MAG: helix-turn-helix domain-containing protein [Streptomyces sp.]|nr:helix-turn-helix domain-containing protein [Streptomyces sp.]